MRLWSLHPKYLDAKGLVALWREALLAKHVLEGRTTGKLRDRAGYERLTADGRPDTFSVFKVVAGGVESWEKN